MPLNNQELAALADYLVEVVECDPEYEDDAFAITFYSVRCFCTRCGDHFKIEVGSPEQVVELPRIA